MGESWSALLQRALDALDALDRNLPIVVKVSTPVLAVSLGMALYLQGTVGESVSCTGATCGQVARSQVGLVTTDGTALLLVVLWLVFVLFVGRRARRLADVARRVAAGDLSARVNPRGNTRGRWATPPRDELLLVGGQFDLMLDTLTEEQHRLQALTELLEHQANHDSLTGLPNRRSFAERLAGIAGAEGVASRPFAIVMIGLDDFRTVNDGLGHATGDLILTATATRLSAAVRGDEQPARLLGDEFAILLDDLTDEGDVLAFTHRLLAAVAVPIDLEGATIVLRASAGVLIHRAGGSPVSADGLLRDAHLALDAAKRAPVDTDEPGRVVAFDPAMRTAVIARATLAAELHGALDRGELRVYYQPYARLEEPTTVVGFEALVRWQHPTRGLIAPDDFVPLAEVTGLIRPIGLWVLEEACRTAVAWREEHPGLRLTMSVNLAPQQLLDHDLPSRVADVLARRGMRAPDLVLELTETAMMLDLASAATRLEALRALGVRLAIDDFGTGQSSLSYLHHLPVDVVKVDRAFTSRLGKDPAAMAMVRAVVDIASSLGLRTVAEGVETPEQLRHLGELGCDIAQGYLLSRPVDAETAGGFLRFPLPVLLATAECSTTTIPAPAPPPPGENAVASPPNASGR